jgi:hypothetical protein
VAPADITQIAALIAACTGATAAIVGGINLVMSIRRERPALSVFLRQWPVGPHGCECCIEVVASNIGHRPVTVVTMGVRMQARLGDGRSWRVDDGNVNPSLQTTLNDGETIAMTWMEQDLGEAFWKGDETIVACFAQYGRGKEAVQTLADPITRPRVNSG